jgi:hypothetical protein
MGPGAHRGRRVWAVELPAASLVGWVLLFSSLGLAQPARGVDPFVRASETIRHSVASLDCLAGSGAETKIVERVGSAFLISAAGDFLTAAHVLREMQESPQCATPALTVSAGEWRPEVQAEPMRWFPVQISNCKTDLALDIAECPLTEDLSARKRDLHLRVEPVQFEWDVPPDGTPVAFTGFPLRARDPMTFRADVAAYRIPWSDGLVPELVLDRPTLPGFSGSPVFRADGRVVGILIKNGTEDATGITIARPVALLRRMLANLAARGSPIR